MEMKWSCCFLEICVNCVVEMVELMVDRAVDYDNAHSIAKKPTLAWQYLITCTEKHDINIVEWMSDIGGGKACLIHPTFITT